MLSLRKVDPLWVGTRANMTKSQKLAELGMPETNANPKRGGRIVGTLSWYVHGFTVYRAHAKTETMKMPTSEITPALTTSTSKVESR